MKVIAPPLAEAHIAPPGQPLPTGSVPGNNPPLED